MEYISKPDLIAEIKRMKKEVASYNESNSYIDHERYSTLDEIQSFIDSMKVEEVKYEANNSEDEHIRKWLMTQLIIKMGDNPDLDYMINKALDWLVKQGEQKYIGKFNVIKFIRQETCCGLAEADNALSKLINVLKERPHLILDKPHELTIKWNQNMNNFIHCPECKSNFHFADSDIIEDVFVVCPTCKNKICLLQ